MGKKKFVMIPRVDDNKEKENTYRKLHEHYTNATDAGYYLEAMVLVYAMLEDRFNEILRVLKIADYGEKSFVVTSGLERAVRALVEPKSDEDKITEELNTISGKYNILKKLASDNAPCPQQLLLRREIVQSADKNGRKRKTGDNSKKINKIIREIQEWNQLRDQFIHALFNKQFDAAMEKLPEHAEKGLELARELDNYCGRVITQVKKKDL